MCSIDWTQTPATHNYYWPIKFCGTHFNAYNDLPVFRWLRFFFRLLLFSFLSHRAYFLFIVLVVAVVEFHSIGRIMFTFSYENNKCRNEESESLKSYSFSCFAMCHVFHTKSTAFCIRFSLFAWNMWWYVQSSKTFSNMSKFSLFFGPPEHLAYTRCARIISHSREKMSYGLMFSMLIRTNERIE